MRMGEVFQQLQKRRVIRAAVIYVALLWVVLQAADVFAEADIISGGVVRWLIIAGVAGLPLVLAGSWFLESPWKQRRSMSVAGDILIIVAIAAAAFLFAWQQWFSSFTRPVVAILPIEATDTRDDTQLLAKHIAERLRMLLATRAEIRVIELSNSHHVGLDGRSAASKAKTLNAGFLIAGALSRGGESLRLTLQLMDSDGVRLWGDVFAGRLVGMSQMQSAALSGVVAHLPVPGAALEELQEIIAACDYPADGSAIMAIVSTADLGVYLRSNADNGLLFLAQAKRLFAAVRTAPPPHEVSRHDRWFATGCTRRAVAHCSGATGALVGSRQLHLQIAFEVLTG